MTLGLFRYQTTVGESTWYDIVSQRFRRKIARNTLAQVFCAVPLFLVSFAYFCLPESPRLVKYLKCGKCPSRCADGQTIPTNFSSFKSVFWRAERGCFFISSWPLTVARCTSWFQILDDSWSENRGTSRKCCLVQSLALEHLIQGHNSQVLEKLATGNKGSLPNGQLVMVRCKRFWAHLVTDRVLEKCNSHRDLHFLVGVAVVNCLGEDCQARVGSTLFSLVHVVSVIFSVVSSHRDLFHPYALARTRLSCHKE